VNIRAFDDHEAMSQAVAQAVLQLLEQKRDAVIGLSGGSTPKRFYEILSDQIDPFAATWILVDERYVPIDHPRSNAGMILETLFPRGVPAGQRFLRFDTSFEDPAASARQFSARWDGAADLITLGVGDDGHTASIFPGIDVPQTDVAQAVFVPKLDEWRVTLTLPVIRRAPMRYVLATGESKGTILRGLRDGADYPIGAATRGVETWWFVDRKAYEVAGQQHR
jgi:6-phosphogluconolactonase